MKNERNQAEFEKAFKERIKSWREEKGWTADQMATVLGVPAERYRKYETRSMMPAYLFETFCLVCDANLDNLLLGTQRRPSNRASVENIKGRRA